MDVHAGFELLLGDQAALASDQIMSRPSGVVAERGAVLLAVDWAGLEHVLIPTDREDIPEWSTSSLRLTRSHWNATRQGDSFLDLCCTEPSLTSVFRHFVSDLLGRLDKRTSTDEYELVREVLEEWKAMLSRSGAALSREEAVGIWAELELLEALSAISPSAALHSWTAVQSGQGLRDFQGGDLAIEVKASTAQSGGSVVVHGLKQLDPSENGLHLYFARVQCGPNGRTLWERLNELEGVGFHRAPLRAAAKARGLTQENGLDLRMTTQSTALWILTPNLPFLGPDDIPQTKVEAIEHLSYRVSLAALPEPLDKNQTNDVFSDLLGMAHGEA